MLRKPEIQNGVHMQPSELQGTALRQNSRERANWWNFLLRWMANTLLIGIVLLTASGIGITSYYGAVMVVISLGLMNAGVPHLSGVFTFSTSVVSLMLFALLVNCFLLYLVVSLNIGVSAASPQSIILAGVMAAVMTWFATLAVDSKLIIK